MRIHSSHKSTGQKMAGLLSAIVLPSGTTLLPNNRRVRTLSAYDSRMRYLSGPMGRRLAFMGDDDGIDPSTEGFATSLDTGSTSDIFSSNYDPTSDLGLPVISTTPVNATGGTGIPLQSAQNPAITPSQAFSILQSTATPSSDPSNYVSPSAALAAGIPAATVNSTWATSQGVNSFPSAAAATSALTASLGAAGAAATVAQLWTGGGTTMASGVPWLSQSSIVAGMANSSVLLWAGIGVIGFSLLSGKKKRR